MTSRSSPRNRQGGARAECSLMDTHAGRARAGAASCRSGYMLPDCLALKGARCRPRSPQEDQQRWWRAMGWPGDQPWCCQCLPGPCGRQGGSRVSPPILRADAPARRQGCSPSLAALAQKRLLLLGDHRRAVMQCIILCHSIGGPQLRHRELGVVTSWMRPLADGPAARAARTANSTDQPRNSAGFAGGAQRNIVSSFEQLKKRGQSQNGR